MIVAFAALPAIGGELALSSQLRRELDLVLKAGDSLHKALVQQNEEQVELSLRDVLYQLDRSKTASYLAKPHERRHLMRILEAAREQFELTQTTFGEDRRMRFESGFNQIVNLLRIYRLDRAFTIFFCPKDKTTWIQRGSKPQNPFHPESGSCGMKVPR